MVCLKKDNSFDDKHLNFYPLEFINFTYHTENFGRKFIFVFQRTKEWVTICPNVSKPGYYDTLEDFVSCMFMEKLYLTGGWYERADYEIRICHMYDPETNEWSKLQDMQRGRKWHSCVVFAGKIVVTGGVTIQLRRTTILKINGRTCLI